MADPHGQDEYFVRVTPPASSEPSPGAQGGSRPTAAPPSRFGAVALILLLAAVLALGATALLVGFLAPAADGPEMAADPSAAVAEQGAGAAVVEDGFRLWARREDGSPVRWNPCEPIAWVFNPTGAPPTGLADIEQALSRVAAVTGLTFEHLGTTDELPSRERRLLQEERYGHRWAPVLFAWVETGTTTLPLEQHERGAAVPVAATGSAGKVFVSGQIVLNGSVTLTAGFEDRHGSWGATLLHELGHLVGLDHVDDRSQLMYPTAVFGPADFSAGDRHGLEAVGADGGCLEVPAPQDLEVDFSGFDH